MSTGGSPCGELGGCQSPVRSPCLVQHRLIKEDDAGSSRVVSEHTVEQTLSDVFAFHELEEESPASTPFAMVSTAVAHSPVSPTRNSSLTPSTSADMGGLINGSGASDSDEDVEGRQPLWDPYTERKRQSMLTALEVLAAALCTVLAGSEHRGPTEGAPIEVISSIAAVLVSRYTAACPVKESPWTFSGLNLLATLVATEEVVRSAGPIHTLHWLDHQADLARLELRMKTRRHSGDASPKSTAALVESDAVLFPEAQRAGRSRLASADSISLGQPRSPSEVRRHRLRHAGQDFRPGASFIAELTWRIASAAHDSWETRFGASWITLVPVVRVGVLTRRAWATSALITLSDMLFDCGRYRHALHFATVALSSTAKPADTDAYTEKSPTAMCALTSAKMAACRITVAASKLCLGTGYSLCIAEAASAFRDGLAETETVPAELRVRARFRIASMYLWGGDHGAAMAELVAMHKESVVSSAVDELMTPAPNVTTTTAATVSLGLAELHFADDDGEAAATYASVYLRKWRQSTHVCEWLISRYANHAIQILESAPRKDRELADLTTAFMARLARAEDRVQDALGLIITTAKKKSVTIAFEAALIHLAMGDCRLARRLLARLKVQMTTAESPLFWPLPLGERWPNISMEFVEIALLSAHESVLALGPAPWQLDDDCAVCTRCKHEFTFMIRKHHCRSCGMVVCDYCSQHREYLSQPAREYTGAGPATSPPPALDADVPCTLQRICDACKSDFEALECLTTMSRICAAY